MALRSGQGQRKKYLTMDLSNLSTFARILRAVVSEFQFAKIGVKTSRRQPPSVREEHVWTTPSTINADTPSSTCRKDTEHGCTHMSRPCRTRWTCACSTDCRRST